jgi:predicted DNA-binding protein
MTGKKLISIRISSETDKQINRLKEMDKTTQAAVISRAVELYFNERVDTEMSKRLRGIPFETMKEGETYLLQVNDDKTIEIIAPDARESDSHK